MKRVLVIGSCGAGKSTFSRRLHEITGIPLIHLDRHYWKPGWVESQKDEWETKVDRLTRGDAWIIDGNYGGSMDLRMSRADTVFWLDLPRIQCCYRVLRRSLNKAPRPDMAEGCDERFEWDFLKYVWNFPRDKNPKIRQRISLYRDQITLYRFENSRRVARFFNGAGSAGIFNKSEDRAGGIGRTRMKT